MALPPKPDERFPAVFLTRADIADMINLKPELVGLCDHDQLLKPDDQRLTRIVCEDFAEEYGDLLELCATKSWDEGTWQDKQFDLSGRWSVELGLITQEDSDGVEQFP